MVRARLLSELTVIDQTAQPIDNPRRAAAFKAWATRRGGDTPNKVMISIRLDRDVVAAFRALGPGWQRAINDTLKANQPTPAERAAAKARHRANARKAVASRRATIAALEARAQGIR